MDSFLRNEAVRKCLNDAEVKKAYESGRIVKARCVLTWKLVPPEDREAAVRDQQENAETLHTRDGKKKAKARIVFAWLPTPQPSRPDLQDCIPSTIHVGRDPGKFVPPLKLKF